MTELANFVAAADALFASAGCTGEVADHLAALSSCVAKARGMTKFELHSTRRRWHAHPAVSALARPILITGTPAELVKTAGKRKPQIDDRGDDILFVLRAVLTRADVSAFAAARKVLAPFGVAMSQNSLHITAAILCGDCYDRTPFIDGLCKRLDADDVTLADVYGVLAALNDEPDSDLDDVAFRIGLFRTNCDAILTVLAGACADSSRFRAWCQIANRLREFPSVVARLRQDGAPALCDLVFMHIDDFIRGARLANALIDAGFH